MLVMAVCITQGKNDTKINLHEIDLLSQSEGIYIIQACKIIYREVR